MNSNFKQIRAIGTKKIRHSISQEAIDSGMLSISLDGKLKTKCNGNFKKISDGINDLLSITKILSDYANAENVPSKIWNVLKGIRLQSHNILPALAIALAIVDKSIVVADKFDFNDIPLEVPYLANINRLKAIKDSLSNKLKNQNDPSIQRTVVRAIDCLIYIMKHHENLIKPHEKCTTHSWDAVQTGSLSWFYFFYLHGFIADAVTMAKRSPDQVLPEITNLIYEFNNFIATQMKSIEDLEEEMGLKPFSLLYPSPLIVNQLNIDLCIKSLECRIGHNVRSICNIREDKKHIDYLLNHLQKGTPLPDNHQINEGILKEYGMKDNEIERIKNILNDNAFMPFHLRWINLDRLTGHYYHYYNKAHDFNIVLKLKERSEDLNIKQTYFKERFAKNRKRLEGIEVYKEKLGIVKIKGTECHNNFLQHIKSAEDSLKRCLFKSDFDKNRVESHFTQSVDPFMDRISQIGSPEKRTKTWMGGPGINKTNKISVTSYDRLISKFKVYTSKTDSTERGQIKQQIIDKLSEAKERVESNNARQRSNLEILRFLDKREKRAKDSYWICQSQRLVKVIQETKQEFILKGISMIN